MKEYGPAKSLAEMTREERLVLGAKLIKARERLRSTRAALSGSPQLVDVNVYDVFVVCDSEEDFVQIREDSLTASDSEGYDREMRAAGLNRCRRLRTLTCELLDERLAEITRKLDAI